MDTPNLRKQLNDSITTNVNYINRIATLTELLRDCETALAMSDQEQEHPITQDLLTRIEALNLNK